MNIPIQAVFGLCTGFLSVIGGLIIWYLTKLLGEVKDLKGDMKTLEEKKVNKDILEIQLITINQAIENGFNSVNQRLDQIVETQSQRLDQIVETQIEIRQDLSGFGKRVDERLKDHDRQLAELRK